MFLKKITTPTMPTSNIKSFLSTHECLDSFEKLSDKTINWNTGERGYTSGIASTDDDDDKDYHECFEPVPPKRRKT